MRRREKTRTVENKLGQQWEGTKSTEPRVKKGGKANPTEERGKQYTKDISRKRATKKQKKQQGRGEEKRDWGEPTGGEKTKWDKSDSTAAETGASLAAQMTTRHSPGVHRGFS